MKEDLVSLRGDIIQRIDRALAEAWPDRIGDRFVAEMQWGARELRLLADRMRDEDIGLSELCRTYRYLGSLHVHLEAAIGRPALLRAVAAYHTAVELAERQTDQLERAKVVLNWLILLSQLLGNDFRQHPTVVQLFKESHSCFGLGAPTSLDPFFLTTKSVTGLLPSGQSTEPLSRGGDAFWSNSSPEVREGILPPGNREVEHTSEVLEQMIRRIIQESSRVEAENSTQAKPPGRASNELRRSEKAVGEEQGRPVHDTPLLDAESDSRDEDAGVPATTTAQRPATSELNLSVAHPRLLSKKHESMVVLQIYLPELRTKVDQAIRRQFHDGGTDHTEERVLRVGQMVRLKLSSPSIIFSDSIVKRLDQPLSRTNFLARPADSCEPGQHDVILSVTELPSENELLSLSFMVQVTDFAFDHVSRPLVSKVASTVTGIFSVAMFILSIMHQIDSTFGLTAGSAAATVLTVLVGRFLFLFRRPVLSTPSRTQQLG